MCVCEEGRKKEERREEERRTGREKRRRRRREGNGKTDAKRGRTMERERGGERGGEGGGGEAAEMYRAICDNDPGKKVGSS